MEKLVSMKGITKTFPGVLALDQVDFELEAGEVMALLGENGAGKSTLMKVLSGIHGRDAGELCILGKNYGDLSPKSAREAGVAIIHQEMNLCNQLTVAENIFLGRERRHGIFLDNAAMNREAEKYLEELGISVPADRIAGELQVSRQQMVEIAKALSVQARILIMDEPTSALSSREIEELFRIIRKLKEQGHGIVYISHRLDELSHIADRVSIMRDGKMVSSGSFSEYSMDHIISLMVGREIREQYPRIDCAKGRKIFEVKNLNAGRKVRNISFSLYEGEIVGIAGLMGAGRTELTRAIFGADPRESGSFYLDEREIRIERPDDAIRAGIVLAPEDRRKDGLCTRLSIRQNLALPNLDRICRGFGVIDSRKERALCREAIENLKVKAPGMETEAGLLSGGNQQKIVVGKWLLRNSRLVIFDEPTRGIDVGAKVEIYQLMNRLKKQGIGVLFVSSEMPELMGLADRILVICDGRITGELSAAEASQSEILKLATAFEKKI